jgi:hypothetical protein
LKLKILAGVMTAMNKLLRKEPKPLYEHLLQGIVGWLAKGYKISSGQKPDIEFNIISTEFIKREVDHKFHCQY